MSFEIYLLLAITAIAAIAFIIYPLIEVFISEFADLGDDVIRKD